MITQIPIPASGGITAGPDGNIWVTEDGRIGQFVLAEPVVTPTTAPPRLITGPSTGPGATPPHLAATDAAVEAFASSDGQVVGHRTSL